jgi:hypothetical protein
MAQPSYKYEVAPAVAEYLYRACNAQQIRGEQQAKDLVAVLEVLRNPKNAGELEKEQFEKLKAKYESITDEKSE